MSFIKFYTNDFDDDIVILSENSNAVSYKCLKSLIICAIEVLKTKKQNIVIDEKNNFNFIIKFFACIFSHKNIYLVSDKNQLNSLDSDYDIFFETDFVSTEKTINFEKIDPEKTIINFFTSGSSSKSKIIRKSLDNLIKEAQDLGEELKINADKVISTTTMCHLFGMTFHLMFPFINDLKIYTPTIFYPDDINIQNAILISTPTFLNTIEKHGIEFKISPKCVISAGSKLKENVFKYIDNKTDVIEIYGSTETGIIAYKQHYNEELTLFKKVQIKSNENSILITSPYAYNNSAIINDKIEIKGNKIIIKNRTDRVYKIYDKRINAEEIENKLTENEFINDCYVLENDNKLCCLCAINKNGQDFLIKNGIFELKKALKSYINTYFEIIPQNWKFIDIIPRNQAGKFNKALIKHIFNVNLSLPIILNREKTENKIEYEIYFPSSCNFFNGHFPSVKILAGVVQIYIAKEFANVRFDLELAVGQWKRIKFSNIILPDKIIKLNLEKQEKSVLFKFYDGEKIYSTGVFDIKNIFKENKCI